MDKKYPDLNGLLQDDAGAKSFWDGLPDYVRDQIGTRAASVQSLESLKNYAENLLRGDD